MNSNNPYYTQHTMTQTKDFCYGCRRCYESTMNATAENKVVACILMGIPTYYLALGWMFQDALLEFIGNSRTSSGPIIVVFVLNAIGWALEIASVKWNMPNLLGICAFAHSAFGSWWMINFIIIFFAGWSYIPVKMMFPLLFSIMLPAFLWHITGDILRASKRKILRDIERAAAPASHYQVENAGPGLPKV
jgi:hypothetical protein